MRIIIITLSPSLSLFPNAFNIITGDKQIALQIEYCD